MALSNLTTPGVYIQEISTLPSSIVPVATAIPGFLGYTEKTIIDGAQWDYSANSPDPNPAPAVRITSMVEFQQAFGGAFHEKFDMTIDINGNPIVKAVSVTLPGDAFSPYSLFYHMQMYFANGGGPCHIISVGNYNYASPALDPLDFYDPANPTVGLGQAEKVDEITLLVAPEVIAITDSGTGDPDPNAIKPVYDAMLAQCNKLKDRFSIFDVVRDDTLTPNADAANFRSDYVGANYLKYGATYYPPLVTTLQRNYSDDDVRITADNRTVAAPNKFATAPNNRLSTVLQGIGTWTLVAITGPLLSTDTLTITVNNTTTASFSGFAGTGIADEVVAAINAHPVLSLVARAQLSTVNPTTDFYVVVRAGVTSNSSTVLAVTGSGSGAFPATTTNTGGLDNSQDLAIYNKTKAAITDISGLILHPSATMAGIYAAVDNDRGVWKAPANVGVTGIVGPSVMVTESQQGDLNVDATSGKSINVIRSFVGRGTIVWGSRTLDGNSNEWRYVPVRRLFIMAEESTKKASEFVVFEPNDKNTWLRVKAMITNFLTDLWKQGALAGDKPEQAFFVKVGLNETMTAQDILEGKMIVTIGMAAVRPAEFIILQFMHKLQEA